MTARPQDLPAAYISTLIGAQSLNRLRKRFEDGFDVTTTEDRIDYVTAWKVVSANVETMADEGHSLSSQAVPNGNFELLIASMMQGRSLLDGLQRIAVGARILRPDLDIRSGLHARRLHLGIRFASGETAAQAVYLEAMAIVMHCAVCWGLGRDVAAQSVRGPRLINPDAGSWLDLLSPVVRRDRAEVCIVYSEADAQRAIKPEAFGRWHDAIFAVYKRLVVKRVGAPTIADISSRVRVALLQGAKGQERVARDLAMSVPTLRRRLADEGTSFRAIQAALRKDAAQLLLLGDKSVDEIAAELGLSDARCFRRACNSWFGGSPVVIRQTLKWPHSALPEMTQPDISAN
jgi:AraC-like DNA-binding protein